MINYIESLKRPFADFQKFIIGVAFSILPILNFFALGYILDASKLSMKKRFELPEWKDFGRLFIDGLLAMVIQLVYFIPALIILLVGVGYTAFSKDFLATMARGDLMSVGEVFSILGPLIFVFVLLGIIAVYIYPVAIFLYIDSKKLGHAFNLQKVLAIAFSSNYPGPWIISILIVAVISGVLNYVKYIGQPLGYFIGNMILFTILSQAYYEAKTRI